MKNQFVFKYEIFIPIIAAVLFFFTRKIPLTGICYTIFALLAAIWYFPVQLFFGRILKEEFLKNKIVKIIATIILALIMGISVILLYNADSFFFRTTFQVLSILNVFLLYYFHFANKEARLFFIHLAFMFLTGAVFVA